MRSMEPLLVRKGLVIPAEHLSMAFTRNLEGDEDAATAARTMPSVVELRFDTRGCPGLAPDEIEKIVAWPPLRADRRGTVRVVCGEYRSRPKNLAGAREQLARALAEALAAPLTVEEVPPPKRRRRAGLMKAR